ncbi:MAG: hypothetical protein ACYCWL_16400, partial [Thauera sp.]
EERRPGVLADRTDQPLLGEASIDELMGEIRPLHPKTGARGLKGLEKQRQKRKNRSSGSVEPAGLGDRAQNVN